MRFGGGRIADGFYGSGYFMMPFVMIICLILIAAAVFFIIRVINKDKFTKLQEDNSINILKERFARSEISEEEFTKKLELLKKK